MRAEGERVGRAGVRPLIVCPRCEGQMYDLGSCGFCANTGYLREDGERLSYAEQVQILSTFALATDIELTAPQPPLARDPEWPASECVCAETSTRNCPVHQNAGDPE